MTTLEMIEKLQECGDISVSCEPYTTDEGLPIFEIMVEDYDMDEDVDLKLYHPELVEELKNTFAKQALETVFDFQDNYYFKNYAIHFQYRSAEKALLEWED